MQITNRIYSIANTDALKQQNWKLEVVVIVFLCENKKCK